MNILIRLFSIVLLFLFFGKGVSAQTIEVNLPSFPYFAYVFCLNNGAQQDTIVSRKLDKQGKDTFTLPAEYSSYRGVGKFTLKYLAKKNVNVIINNEEKITIGEAENEELVITGSKENDFLATFLTRQTQLLREYNAINAEFNTFSLNNLRHLASKQRLEERYATFFLEINASPLYAARIAEILTCLSSIGFSLGLSQEDIQAEQREYITQKLSFDNLYTCGFWQLTMDTWYNSTLDNDSLLISDSKALLDKTTNIPVRRELTQSIIRLFTKYAKDSLLMELGMEYLTIPLNGQKAPEIKDGEISFLPQNTLILFFETGCGNCHYELEELKKKYDLLMDNKVNVIAISADSNQDVFEYTSNKYPWNMYCDFEGFDGVNFRNYGIVGTPTYILVDKEGVVRGRYAHLSDLLGV